MYTPVEDAWLNLEYELDTDQFVLDQSIQKEKEDKK